MMNYNEAVSMEDSILEIIEKAYDGDVDAQIEL